MTDQPSSPTSLSKRATFSDSNPRLKLQVDTATEGGDIVVVEEKAGAKSQWLSLSNSWQTVREWWADITPFERDTLVASTVLKLLLFPS